MVASTMSNNRQTGQDEVGGDGGRLKDPRDNEQFRAVWEKLEHSLSASRIISFLHGEPYGDMPPSVKGIVAAFFNAADDPNTITADQVADVILVCRAGAFGIASTLRLTVQTLWAEMRGEAPEPEPAAPPASAIPAAQSVTDFIAAGTLPQYLIEPVIQRGSLYTVTALTSHGKTAVLLYIALCIASGRSVAGKHTERGRVVWFAGENPDDFRQKVVTACHHWNIDPADLDMVVLAGAFDLASNIEEAKAIADAGGDTAMVVVDTSAAYRLDDGEDDNTNSLAWARILRVMLGLNGKPAVLAATHPTKYAAADNLLPRGGSSFLNEVDGNLTLWADEEQATTTLHWQGKFRGMTFAPIQFALQACQHPTWTLRNGDPVTIKLAVPTGEAAPRYQPPKRGRPPSGKARLARKLLADLIVDEGKPGYAPANLLAVPETRWRSEFFNRACLNDDKPNTKRVRFLRASEELVDAETIAINAGWVWLIHPEVV